MNTKARITVEDTETPEAARFNGWVTIAKNAIWVIGLIALGVLKLSNIDAINNAQDEKLARMQEENKLIKANIDSINNKQVEQLVMLTKLVTIAEQRQESPDRKGK